jgi:hypothetical protein
MHHLVQLGMGYAQLPAADRRHTFNAGVVERMEKSVSADHSRRAHDDKAFVAGRRNIHGSSRCSSQST